MPAKRRLEFKETETGCFEVTSHLPNSRGYVYFWHGRGVRERAHRFIYEQCFGPAPDGLIVRHSCDNRRCINPEHLLVGTIADNQRDMVERGRQRKNETHQCAKLTNADVLAIRRSGERRQILARRYKVTESNIGHIRARRSWRYLPEEA